MSEIIKTQLHPERDNAKTLYPETSPDQIVGLLDYLKSAGITDGKGGIDKFETIDSVVEDNFTITTVRVTFHDQTTQDFNIKVKNGATGATGATGVGISHIENDGFSQGEGFTISHIKATLTDGAEEHFDIQAKDGLNGGYKYYVISAPESATSGNLTLDIVNDLQANKDKVLILNNETYRFADDMSTEGYLVYSHLGMDNTQNAFAKFITITISTYGWVLTQKEIGAGGKNLSVYSVVLTETILNHDYNIKFLAESGLDLSSVNDIPPGNYDIIPHIPNGSGTSFSLIYGVTINSTSYSREFIYQRVDSNNNPGVYTMSSTIKSFNERKL